MADTMVTSPVKNEHNTRKNKKPLMEKRRRARINHCLTQLKSLVLQAVRKDSFSKLEKADILELTVNHLRAIQQQRSQGHVMTPPEMNVASKYRAGFSECAKEVVRYLESVREMKEDVKERLAGHLASCIQVINHLDPLPQQHLESVHAHGPPQQSVAAVAPSIILSTSHPAMAFNPVAVRSSVPAASPPSSSLAATTALSAMSMQRVPSAVSTAIPNTTNTTPTVVSHGSSPASISRAFEIVPSTSSPSGAVALYLGSPDLLHRTDTSTMGAVPLYSVSLPTPANADRVVTAFVTPPLSSHATSSATDSGCRTDSVTNLSPSHFSPSLQTGRNIDHTKSAGQCCSPSSVNDDEKVWRPW